MKINNMLGFKIFKEEGDDLLIYRITKIKNYKDGAEPSSITVKDLDTGEEKIVKVEELKDFTPLTPDGYITFNQVHIINNGKVYHDVIITASKILNLKVGDTAPYAVCRQSCTDIFYNLICKSEDDMIVGLAVNQDDCPTNFDFRQILACDGIDKSQYVNYYRTDTLEDVMPMIKTHGMNDTLEKLYTEHIKASKNTSAMFKKEDRGWCKDLDTLLKENSFQADIDQMLGITAVDFNIKDYIVTAPLPGKTDEEYETVTDDLKYWLASTYNTNINNISIVKYGYDIDLADFNNSRYFLLRDNTKTLYLLVYTIDKDELEIDLINKANEPDLSTKFRLEFYNKYNQYNKDNNN